MIKFLKKLKRYVCNTSIGAPCRNDRAVISTLKPQLKIAWGKQGPLFKLRTEFSVEVGIHHWEAPETGI